MDERFFYLAFSAFPAIGPAKFRKLLLEFGTAKAAWKAQKPEFSIEDYVKKLKEKDVWFVTLKDKEYPALLKEIKNPPYVLYGRGDIDILAGPAPTFPPASARSIFSGKPSAGELRAVGSPSSRVTRNFSTIAVVGARKTTEYGREVTKLLTTELVLNGFTIVSGLALGVDAISHMTALENNGETIAVLGCGVDCCNPGENQSIYNSIVEHGLVVSEFPLGMKPTQWTFPARNRIIAGLSQAVLVTEGAEDSGSLITAEFALKFNRKVFAVPGPITSSMSKGPYKLISRGAKLVTTASDILNDFSSPLKSRIKNSELRIKKGETKEERKILDLLQNESLHFDELVRKTKFKSSKLSSLLSLMEIKGMIKTLNSGQFGLAA